MSPVSVATKAAQSYIPGMFFRRKPVTLANLDQRLSVVELALELRREEQPMTDIGPLESALAKLQRAITRDAAKKRPL
jgi:hypothetical protein